MCLPCVRLAGESHEAGEGEGCTFPGSVPFSFHLEIYNIFAETACAISSTRIALRWIWRQPNALFALTNFLLALDFSM